MEVSRPSGKNAIAVIVASTAALFARSWLQMELLREGLQKDHAADLSYLVVFPLLLVLMLPMLRLDKAFLLEQFRPSTLSLSTVLRAIAVGMLIRVLWWSMTIAGVAFGVYRDNDPFAIEGPLFWFQCPPAKVALVGFLVMVIMIPIVEEVTNRAYVQSSLHRGGPVVAIAVSATVFAIFHPPSHWLFTFVAGVVFGIQYWNSQSLWPSLISHATFNGLVQVDWRCLHGIWNPPISDLPLWRIGIAATAMLLIATILVVRLTGDAKERRDGQPPRR